VSDKQRSKSIAKNVLERQGDGHAAYAQTSYQRCDIDAEIVANQKDNERPFLEYGTP
jgi:hypothetical protein